VTRVPHAVVVTGEPAAVMARAVVEEVAGERIVMGSWLVAESEPDVPVMVAVAAPSCAELAAVRVRTLPMADEAGFQLEVTPEGKPAMEKLTLPVNPLSAPTVTEVLSEPPGKRVMLPGAGVSVNDGATTVSVTVVDAVIEPEVPVIVTVEVPAVAELLAVKVMDE